MEPVIKTRGLGKRYRIGEVPPYRTLREGIVEAFEATAGRLFGSTSRRESGVSDMFWAIRDISFEVMPGEVVGLVGGNGAGKSTLLKVLSRVTTPTAGSAELNGRVGTLLEVGTGFHLELSGRENVFLSGAILGMKRAEIARKFDQIVAFAGVEQFIDTPVKHYSSGMHVRLAFAVAAHLESEILLVDEVLAVGDAIFQRKCLGKMGEVAKEGRTILFVSHNMAAIESLCSSAILLERGRITAIDKPDRVVDQYSRLGVDQPAGRADLRNHSGRHPAAHQKRAMTEVVVSGVSGDIGVVRTGQRLVVEVAFDLERPIRPCLGFTVKTERGYRIFHLSDRYEQQLSSCAPMRSGSVICEIPELPLLPGRYWLDIWFEDAAVWAPLDMIEDAVSFDVTSSDLFGSGRLPPPIFGPVVQRGVWRIVAPEEVSWSRADRA
ncbi:MAG TPA: ABC transporter ATP-binding protein [Candidatus Binataceae bacterium]